MSAQENNGAEGAAAEEAGEGVGAAAAEVVAQEPEVTTEADEPRLPGAEESDDGKARAAALAEAKSARRQEARGKEDAGKKEPAEQELAAAEAGDAGDAGAEKPLDQKAKNREAFELRQYRKKLERERAEFERAASSKIDEIAKLRAEVEAMKAAVVPVGAKDKPLDAIDKMAAAAGMTREQWLRSANEEYVGQTRPEAAIPALQAQIREMSERLARADKEREEREAERVKQGEEREFKEQLVAFIPKMRDAEMVRAFPSLAVADDEDVERVVRGVVDAGGLQAFRAEHGRSPTMKEWAQLISVDKRVSSRHARYTSAGFSSGGAAEKPAARSVETPGKKDAPVNGARKPAVLDDEDDARAQALAMMASLRP